MPPRKSQGGGDALSRKTQHNLNTIVITQPHILRDLECLGVELVSHGRTNALLSVLEVQSSSIEELKLHQKGNTKLQKVRQNLEKGKSPRFIMDQDGH